MLIKLIFNQNNSSFIHFIIAGGAEWMPMQPQMQRNTNCPPGLEYLAAIDQLLVHQKVELLEAFTGFETGNKYTVKNSMGQNVFKAKEESDCCSRQFCGPMRSFGMKILDNNGTEVMHLNRPLACASCCFPCCLQVSQSCYSSLLFPPYTCY